MISAMLIRRFYFQRMKRQIVLLIMAMLRKKALTPMSDITKHDAQALMG